MLRRIKRWGRDALKRPQGSKVSEEGFAHKERQYVKTIIETLKRDEQIDEELVRDEQHLIQILEEIYDIQGEMEEILEAIQEMKKLLVLGEDSNQDGVNQEIEAQINTLKKLRQQIQESEPIEARVQRYWEKFEEDKKIYDQKIGIAKKILKHVFDERDKEIATLTKMRNLVDEAERNMNEVEKAFSKTLIPGTIISQGSPNTFSMPLQK